MFIKWKNERQKLKYRDVSWLMPSVDCALVIERLGLEVDRIRGDEVWSYCPDHHLFTGRRPSHPKWSVNAVTGLTKCLTESRGSNIVFVVCRCLGCDPDAAVEWMSGRGHNRASLSMARFSSTIERLMGGRESRELKSPAKAKAPTSELQRMADEVEIGHLSQRALDYFMYPPGKKPTLIAPETVRSYRCFERTWGRYRDRVVVPFFHDGQIVGFCAIDVLGKDEWLRRHPLVKDEKKYRKVLYSDGFSMSTYLFGLDELDDGLPFVILTEGAREVMKLTQEGLPGVALLHADISPPQVAVLARKNPRELVVMLDGDPVGYENSTKIAATLNKSLWRSRVRIASLPRGYDPKNLSGNDLRILREKAILYLH